MKNYWHYIVLILAAGIYSVVGVLTRFAAGYSFLSWHYIFFIAASLSVLAVYAVMWQQILKCIALSTAYMFKGISLIFTMIFANLLFCEQITANNVIGASVIIIGISLYAKE